MHSQDGHALKRRSLRGKLFDLFSDRSVYSELRSCLFEAVLADVSTCFSLGFTCKTYLRLLFRSHYYSDIHLGTMDFKRAVVRDGGEAWAQFPRLRYEPLKKRVCLSYKWSNGMQVERRLLVVYPGETLNISSDAVFADKEGDYDEFDGPVELETKYGCMCIYYTRHTSWRRQPWYTEVWQAPSAKQRKDPCDAGFTFVDVEQLVVDRYTMPQIGIIEDYDDRRRRYPPNSIEDDGDIDVQLGHGAELEVYADTCGSLIKDEDDAEYDLADWHDSAIDGDYESDDDPNLPPLISIDAQSFSGWAGDDDKLRPPLEALDADPDLALAIAASLADQGHLPRHDEQTSPYFTS